MHGSGDARGSAWLRNPPPVFPPCSRKNKSLLRLFSDGTTCSVAHASWRHHDTGAHSGYAHVSDHRQGSSLSAAYLVLSSVLITQTERVLHGLISVPTNADRHEP